MTVLPTTSKSKYIKQSIVINGDLGVISGVFLLYQIKSIGQPKIAE
jgi:hypothetical protein